MALILASVNLGPQRPRGVLVHHHRRLVVGLLRAGRVRLRHRHPARRGGPGRPRPPGADQHDRPGLGRQRGVAARSRWRHFRRLPELVRDAVQRVLPSAVPDLGGTHIPRRGIRVPLEARASRLARRLGPRDLLGQPPPGPLVGSGFRQHPARRAHRPRTSPIWGRSSTFSIPIRCSAGSRHCSCSPSTARSSPP